MSTIGRNRAAPIGSGPAGFVAQFGPHAALAVYNLVFVLAYAPAQRADVIERDRAAQTHPRACSG